MNFPVKNFSVALALAATLASGGRLLANDIDYSNLVTTDIVFNGHGQFSFSNTGNPAANIEITNSTTGTSDGLDGEITGTYTIGAVSHVGIISTALVTGTGLFKVYDGVNTLTATLTWDNIVQIGTGSALDDNGTVNLSTITYTGSDVDLLELKDALSASNTLDFTFNPALSLAALKTTAAETSFSGSITYDYVPVPDSGTTALLTGLGIAAMALGLIAQKRKNRTA